MCEGKCAPAQASAAPVSEARNPLALSPITDRRRRPLRAVAAAACLAGVGVVTLAFRSASEEKAPVSAAKPSVAAEPVRKEPAPSENDEPLRAPRSELLSITIEPMELVEPPGELLAEGTSWVHPVIGSEQLVPSKRTRLFGAMRPGARSEECGKGHCGVDLDGPRGTPVVAIREGIIERVVRDEDARGGRYVWLYHEDIGLRTEYFHIDQIAPDVRQGEPVQAGQWLGTLGKTGIEHSEPHLHFTVRDVEDELRYLDPAPFLEEAQVIELLDMRLAESL